MVRQKRGHGGNDLEDANEDVIYVILRPPEEKDALHGMG